ncbi:MAG TPA: SgcQ protein [Anaerolineaceae bacterium]|nr:SgcQ protein [Anaerolineaceae bacterium]
MNWINNIFRTEKPIIAMLHLNALPGDPLYGPQDSMNEIVRMARQDLHNLQDGGVDGIIFSNEFSLPYQRAISLVTVSAMARVIGELMSDLRIPFGVDVISDAQATIELAAATGARFARGTFTGAYVGDGGVQNTDVSKTLRRKHDLNLFDLRLLYFVNQESDVYINDRDIQAIARSMIFKCAPDGLCVSGESAGSAAGLELFSRVKEVASQTPVFANTGCNIDNIADILSICDGAVVATTFKKDGKFENHVDLERVKAFMDRVKELRKN